ncbi:MAG TPA: hypothetical protein VJ981_01080 [Gammaproteobacteria bacterium]|nr:hypothetical protein [Gammaproteobacteria bacterium]
MFQNKAEIHLKNSMPGLHTSNIDDQETRESINRLIRHLDETGKICPRAWYWERFFILFKPRYEPCWLSSWWRTPVEDKKELFRKQLFYLAYRTSRFPAACKFLYDLDTVFWLYK